MPITRLDNALKKAGIRAVNRVIVTARKSATEEVRKKYNIKAAKIKEKTRLFKASRTRLGAALVISAGRMGLINFSARQTKRGVTVLVKKTSGRKRIKSGFIATAKGGRNIWQRMTKSRLPIRRLTTIGPATMFEVEGEKAFREATEKNFRRVLDRELSFRLSKRQ